MRILALIALAVLALYVSFVIAVNSAANVALKVWGATVNQQPAEVSSGSLYPAYQLQPAVTPQQPKSVILEAAPSNALQP